MNTVEPIRDIEKVWDIADWLKERNERNYVLFMFGIYSGLRISDILKIKVRDVKGKNYIYIREQKTGKEKRFFINKDLKAILSEYIKENDKKDYQFLFESREGSNKAITRQQAYNILSAAAAAFGLDNIGTHTLRKTWGYHVYKQTKDIVAIQDILNHSNPSVTMRYIGINQDNKDNVMKSISFKRAY